MIDCQKLQIPVVPTSSHGWGGLRTAAAQRVPAQHGEAEKAACNARGYGGRCNALHCREDVERERYGDR